MVEAGDGDKLGEMLDTQAVGRGWKTLRTRKLGETNREMITME